jgi:hypothetical protein
MDWLRSQIRLFRATLYCYPNTEPRWNGFFKTGCDWSQERKRFHTCDNVLPCMIVDGRGILSIVGVSQCLNLRIFYKEHWIS